MVTIEPARTALPAVIVTGPLLIIEAVAFKPCVLKLIPEEPLTVNIELSVVVPVPLV